MPKKKYNFRFDDETVVRLDQLCSTHGLNRTEMLEALIEGAEDEEPEPVRTIEYDAPVLARGRAARGSHLLPPARTRPLAR